MQSVPITTNVVFESCSGEVYLIQHYVKLFFIDLLRYWYFNMLFGEMCLSQNLHKLESCISRTLNKIFNRILEVFVIEFLDDFLRGGNQKH
jgi:hypothetical protein